MVIGVLFLVPVCIQRFVEVKLPNHFSSLVSPLLEVSLRTIVV
jgi:hypothetical protein